MLGPLANPAGVRRMLLGVYDPQWLLPLAESLAALGMERAFVVHGDGLDEITVCGSTEIAVLRDGAISSFTITPEEFGLKRRQLDEIRGGDGAANAVALRRVLEGEAGAYRDIVLLNAAAALCVAGRTDEIGEGLVQAARAIDDGSALHSLDTLVATTRDMRKTIA